MANRFVRGIKNVRNIDKQPLHTNEQNDLLNDSDYNVYVRTGKKYERITGIEKVEDTLDKMQEQIDVMQPEGDDANERLKQIQQTQDNIKSTVDEVKNKQDATSKDYEKINNQVDKLISRLNSLKDKTDEEIATNQTDISNLRQKTRDMQREIQDISSRKIADEQARKDIEQLRLAIDKVDPEDVKNLRNEIQNIRENLPEEIDLNGYATIDYLEQQLENYVKENELTDYAKKSDIPSLENYAKLSDLPDNEGNSFDESILDDYAKKSDIPSTTDFVKKQSLNNYAKKSDIPNTEDWQKYKLTNDDGSIIYNNTGIDLSNEDDLDNLDNGTRYRVKLNGLPKERTSNNGWLTKYKRTTDDNIARIEFRPYNSSQVFVKNHYKTWGEWEKLFTSSDLIIYSVSSNLIRGNENIPIEAYMDVFGQNIKNVDFKVNVNGGKDLTPNVQKSVYNDNAISLFIPIGDLPNENHIIDLYLNNTLYYQLGVNKSQ